MLCLSLSIFLAILSWTIPSKGFGVSEVTTADNRPDEVTFAWSRTQGDPTQFAFGASATDSSMSNIAFIPPAITVDASITEATFIGTLEGAIQIQRPTVIVAYMGSGSPFFVDGTQTLETTPAPTASTSTTGNTPNTDTTSPWHDNYWDPKPPDANEKRFPIIVVAVLVTLGLIVLALVTWCCIRKRRNREGRAVGESGLLFSPDKMISKGSSLLLRLPGRAPSYRTVDSAEGKTLLSAPSDTSTICDTDTDSTKQTVWHPRTTFLP
ncbi:hypothetical protein PM082_018752 [Marasmius tenuissimus]|nr:hypothetical protein PM082_018752 [Marasmius tenuissimus]